MPRYKVHRPMSRVRAIHHAADADAQRIHT
jgi:hypothetical protein